MVNLDVNGTIIQDIRLAIFDKDGTLMDLYHYWSQMIALRARLIRENLALAEEHQNRLMYAMGVNTRAGRLRPEGPVGIMKREVVLQAAVDYLTSIGHADSHDICFQAFEEVDQISSKDLRRFVRPIDGAHNLVRQLTGAGCKVAIATTDRTGRGELAMASLGLKDMIDLVVGADAVSQSKPSPDMVNLILTRLKVDKSDAAMVGDAITDVQMGINAGLKASIGVCTGLTPDEQLRKVTPYVVNSVSDLRIIIKETT